MERIRNIQPASKAAAEAARKHWDLIAKPLGSFGILEDLIVQIAAVQGTPEVDFSKRTAVVLCADHGIVAEGVSQSGQDVTALSTAAIAEGRSNINALAKAYDTEVIAADLGVAMDFPEGTAVSDEIAEGAVLNRKIARGTANITKEPAMTRVQAVQAVTTGTDLVRDLKNRGTKIIVTGEMGIGNTSIASALAMVYLDLPAEQVTGRGAGLDTASFQRKLKAVRTAVLLHQPDPADPLGVLSKIGGFEIAGMTGVFLGGALYGIPVIIDGVISAAAAYTAYLLNPLCADYMIAGHVSAEPAGRLLPERMGKRAVIDGQLRLGEGTGGILLLPLLDGALALYRNSHTFAGLGIDAYKKLR